jgi:hypothetical protein
MLLASAEPHSLDRGRRAQDYGRHQSAPLPVLRPFGGLFLRLQNAFDMLEAKRRSAKEIARIKPFKAVAA